MASQKFKIWSPTYIHLCLQLKGDKNTLRLSSTNTRLNLHDNISICLTEHVDTKWGNNYQVFSSKPENYLSADAAWLPTGNVGKVELFSWPGASALACRMNSSGDM
jgi:hypothetical protein